MTLKFYRFLFYVTTGCVLTISTLLLLYTTGLRTRESVSFVTLILILMHLGVVAVMTCAFVGRTAPAPAQGWLRRRAQLFVDALQRGIAEEPLLSISLFIILFFSVAIYFGFAFAFHDQARRQENERLPALLMEDLKSPDDASPAETTEQASNPGGTSGGQPGPQPAGNRQLPAEDKFRFYFYSGRAQLPLLAQKCSSTCPNDAPAGDGGVRASEINPVADFSNIAASNYCTLEKIKARIRCETKGGTRVRVEVIGRSDQEQFSSTAPNYPSNYELSEARAENVMFTITQELRASDSASWHNLEWLALPSSNESHPDDEIFQRWVANWQDKLKNETLQQSKRSVIVSVSPLPMHITTREVNRLDQDQRAQELSKSLPLPLPPKPRQMKLMDYMYFSIYTITTTGYGDIIPTTAYAKFLSSLANICEVLFLVVFFNALISLRKTPGPEPQTAKDALPSHPQQSGDGARSDTPVRFPVVSGGA